MGYPSSHRVPAHPCAVWLTSGVSSSIAVLSHSCCIFSDQKVWRMLTVYTVNCEVKNNLAWYLQ